MPSKSAVVFLAGHGSVSSRMEFVDDQSLGSSHVIFPAMSRGQLCFVAHNMILQGFINSRNPDELFVKLQELENVHGVSSMSISHCLQRQTISDVLPGEFIDLTNTAHRQDLRMLWSIIQVMDLIERTDLTSVFSERDLLPLQNGIFASINIAPCLNSFDARVKLKSDITKLFKSSMLLEHKLGTLEGAMKPWQDDMQYRPGDLKTIITMFVPAYGEYTLKFYLDTIKVSTFLQRIQPPQPQELQLCEFDDTIVMYMTNATRDRPILLSDVLKVLAKLHIFVKKTVAEVVEVLDGIIYDSVDDYSPDQFYRVTGEYQVYDCTIPNNANVVWGACRDLGDF